MSDLECAVLVLRTSDLSKTGNISGIKSDYNMSPFTWKNINLRSVLGTMYDKYDRFNLCLTTVCSGGILTALNTYHLSSDPNDNLVVLTISGLPFLNNTYDTKTQHNSTVSTLGCYQFLSTTANINVPIPCITLYTPSNGGNTFGKYQELVDLTICYNRAIDNKFIIYDNVTNTGDYPQVQFIFNIFGIPKEDNNKNGSRLIV